ncbi:hypothetical protein SAMN04488063_0546 [Halopelagius inordinatus]|uniref:Uncharacterized protein n=1 Tax=Halopelagius inordinatus TaxID=553467 RepID=A0A1I2M9A7_9EURY|nr:hypothetical protein [Halopelagius inordinatus]SFF85801.1 hypothetical protein SAMN04488063_0546 [Halopelagius inordinatus]
MSDEDQPGLLKRTYRTVSPGYDSRPDAGMDSVGWTILLLMVVIFIPLLPFLLVVLLVTKVLDALSSRGGDDEESEE